MQSWVGDNPSQKDIEQAILKHPYQLMRAFLKLYIEKYLKNKKLELPDYKGMSKGFEVMTKFLSPEDNETLLQALPKREELICRLLYEGAARQNEILNLKVKEIDFEQGLLHIPYFLGKDKKERIAVLSKELMQELKEWINVNKLDAESNIFNIKKSTLWNILSKTSKSVLNKGVSSHWFKRSRGYWLDVVLNLPLEERQYVLGHRHPDTTQKHYSFRQGSGVIDKLKLIINKEEKEEE